MRQSSSTGRAVTASTIRSGQTPRIPTMWIQAHWKPPGHTAPFSFRDRNSATSPTRLPTSWLPSRAKDNPQLLGCNFSKTLHWTPSVRSSLLRRRRLHPRPPLVSSRRDRKPSWPLPRNNTQARSRSTKLCAAAYSVLAQGLVDYLNSEEAFETYQINYPERQAAFIGQVAWETAHLTTLTQDAAFGTVGTSTGIGRGYLQITGPPNYGAAAAFLHQSLSKTLKSLATDPQTAARVSAWYWSGGTGVSPVNPYADVWNITAVSQLVNAGSVNPVIKKGPNKGKPVQTNGLAERLAYSQAALQAINEAFETD